MCLRITVCTYCLSDPTCYTTATIISKLSRSQALPRKKLRERGEPGIFCHVRNVTFKVVNMGTAISETKLMDKWAASKRTQDSAILCIKLLPLLENALKLNFKALYETENLDPLQGPTHTLTPSSIHTQNRPKNYGWIYHLLSSLVGYSPKLTATLKNRGLATLGFQKNSTHTN